MIKCSRSVTLEFDGELSCHDMVVKKISCLTQLSHFPVHLTLPSFFPFYFIFTFFKFYFIFKLYNIVLVLPNIKMNPPQVYMCSPSWTLLPLHTIPLGRPSAPAPSIQYRASNLDWQLVSYMILYMFQWINFYLFIWLHPFLVEVCRIFSCSMWDLVPRSGIEPRPPALGAWSLSHWTTREVPLFYFFNLKYSWRSHPSWWRLCLWHNIS